MIAAVVSPDMLPHDVSGINSTINIITLISCTSNFPNFLHLPSWNVLWPSFGHLCKYSNSSDMPFVNSLMCCLNVPSSTYLEWFPIQGSCWTSCWSFSSINSLPYFQTFVIPWISFKPYPIILLFFLKEQTICLYRFQYFAKLVPFSFVLLVHGTTLLVLISYLKIESNVFN